MAEESPGFKISGPMKNGLVVGKFMPLHKGHLALIEFALNYCDLLTVLLCYTHNEPIAGNLRKQWLDHTFQRNEKVVVKAIEYDDLVLPNTSESSRTVSKKWANALKKLLPGIDIVFTSEPYGEYLAEYMGIQHYFFDKRRSIVPVSASEIRARPFKYWEFISDAARPWFIKTICIVGTESTGKSTLTEKLAVHFETVYVKEMARDIVETTDTCTYENLLQIAETHANAINEKRVVANKLLFVDTDINITRSYSEFLFKSELRVEKWITEANRFDLYLFLEPDCEYIQDGTRLSAEERNRLSEHHRKFFQRQGISTASIDGNWQNRFDRACKIVKDIFGPLS